MKSEILLEFADLNAETEFKSSEKLAMEWSLKQIQLLVASSVKYRQGIHVLSPHLQQILFHDVLPYVETDSL